MKQTEFRALLLSDGRGLSRTQAKATVAGMTDWQLGRLIHRASPISDDLFESGWVEALRRDIPACRLAPSHPTPFYRLHNMLAEFRRDKWKVWAVPAEDREVTGARACTLMKQTVSPAYSARARQRLIH
ncbi:MAG TPA: hypothetical protein VM120_07155 [Bryobacteraceae bacterium]|nr:hypothetical protein [Bryobacteraceae bacterium]